MWTVVAPELLEFANTTTVGKKMETIVTRALEGIRKWDLN